MKKLTLVFLLCILSIFSNCNKDDSSQEIKVKKNEKAEENKFENKKDDNKNPVESSSLQKITSREVKVHVGDSLIITGYIADVYLSDKVAYLNFENKFPKNVFVCAIFANKFNEFGDLSKYKNKNVEVIGKITTYKNKPQVILSSRDQIRILQ